MIPGRHKRQFPVKLLRTPYPGQLRPRYNPLMAIAKFIITALEILFFTGLVGSTVVAIISFVEDAHELVGKDNATD